MSPIKRTNSLIFTANMPHMSQQFETTLLRRQAIFREYERILIDLGPERATEKPKKKIYEMVADNLNYSPNYVAKVIASFLRKSK